MAMPTAPPMTSAESRPSLPPWVWGLLKPAVATAVAAAARSTVKLAAAAEALAVVPAVAAVALPVKLAGAVAAGVAAGDAVAAVTHDESQAIIGNASFGTGVVRVPKSSNAL